MSEPQEPPLPRLPPPSLLPPPPGLNQLIVHTSSLTGLKPLQNVGDQEGMSKRNKQVNVFVPASLLSTFNTHNTLSRLLWYCLFDIFGSVEVPENQTITAKFESDSSEITGMIQNLGEVPEGQDVTKGAWMQRFGEEALGFPKASSEHLVSEKDESPNYPVQATLPQYPDTLYSRYIPHLSTYICLSVFPKTMPDVELLHTWLNDPRVDRFWKDSGTLEEHVEWLKQRHSCPWSMPVLGSFRDAEGKEERFGYYEAYWADKDPLAHIWDAQPYDRGIHMLIGPQQHRGPHKVRAWLPSLVHYLFLVEPRTQRVVSEPDVRNEAMLNYMKGVGFEKRGNLFWLTRLLQS